MTLQVLKNKQPCTQQYSSQPVEPLGSLKVRKENPRGKILHPCQYDLNWFHCLATSPGTIFSSPPSRPRWPGTELKISSIGFLFFSDIWKEDRLFLLDKILRITLKLTASMVLRANPDQDQSNPRSRLLSMLEPFCRLFSSNSALQFLLKEIQYYSSQFVSKQIIWNKKTACESLSVSLTLLVCWSRYL